MARPLDQDPKAWGFIYMDDLRTLMAIAIIVLMLTVLIVRMIGLGIGLLFGSTILGLSSGYFILKAIMPTNFFQNYLHFRSSPKVYGTTREPSELIDAD